jgi:hypothetical protein
MHVKMIAIGLMVLLRFSSSAWGAEWKAVDEKSVKKGSPEAVLLKFLRLLSEDKLEEIEDLFDEKAKAYYLRGDKEGLRVEQESHKNADLSTIICLKREEEDGKLMLVFRYRYKDSKKSEGHTDFGSEVEFKKYDGKWLITW